MRLVITLATRGRPQQLIDTVSRSICNLVHPETLFIVQADADDQPTQWAFYNSVSQGLKPAAGQMAILVREREDTIAGKWNRALEVPADAYLVAADDDPYITPGYDAKLLEAAARFPDGIGMVYGHYANASFSGAVCPTRGFVEKLGHIFPEYFPYWFVDHWTDDIAKMIGRVTFADVQTDQSRVGPTQEMRETAWWGTWFDAAYMVRRKIATDIIRSPEFIESEWRKDMLVANFPLTEVRSRCVNENLRQTSRSFHELDLADERYQRVKQRAIEMVPKLLEGMPEDQQTANIGANGPVFPAWGAMAYRYYLTPPTTAPALAVANG